jgi:hypothetical protein
MGAIHSCCLCARTEERRRTAPRPARLPNDVVQNVVEYLDAVQDVMESRRVAVGWRTAVAYAIGFLNGRCWDKLLYVPGNSHLRFHRHFHAETPPANVCACTIVSLGAMLKVLHCKLPVDVGPNVIFRACPELVDFALEPMTTTHRSLRPAGYLFLELDVRPCPNLQSLRVSSGLQRPAVLVPGGHSCLADVRLWCMTLDTRIFRELPALTALDLSSCQGCADLTLHERANLRHLNLSYSDITQEAFATLIALSPVNALSLTYLCLRRTRVSSAGIIGLETLPLLATLLLDGTLVDDIQCLQSCPALTSLDISDTNVSDVTPLAQITTLRALAAARTLVADFTPVTRKHLTLRLN